MSKLAGKVVLVTGGTSGIGRSTALAFGEEGAKVVVGGRNVGRGEEVVHQINGRGGEAVFVPVDVARADSVKGLVSKAVSAFGRIDCAFNNAGTEGGPFALTADFPEDEYDSTMAINLKGVWLSMKYEILQMLNQQPEGGSIVNTSSITGLGGVTQGAIYSATKAGVIALTKTAAQEYAQRGIRVNALVAGGFDTPMLTRVFGQVSYTQGIDMEAAKEGFINRVPMNRIGRPDEAAEVVLWLCSDASSYVTGHSMIVDGGMTSWAR